VVGRWLVIRLICELTSVKDRALSTDDAPFVTAEFIPQQAAVLTSSGCGPASPAIMAGGRCGLLGLIANVLALPQSAFAIDTHHHLSRSPYCVPAAIRPVNDFVLLNMTSATVCATIYGGTNTDDS
jgi:hypothetical protein